MRTLPATPLTLTPVEFELLLSLARAKGRVKTREALLDECRERELGRPADRLLVTEPHALRQGIRAVVATGGQRAGARRCSSRMPAAVGPMRPISPRRCAMPWLFCARVSRLRGS